MSVKERFEKKINDLKNALAEGKISTEEFNKEIGKISHAINVLAVTAITDEEKDELLSQFNIINVEEQATENKKGLSTGKKVAAAVGGVAAISAGIIGGLASCNRETKENENQEINSLEVVNSTLSTFVNDCLNNGVDLTTDESLMLMYASNLETQIDVGDNMTLEQVVVAHYINLAEDLIANNENYKGRLVSDVASELMTNDYQSALAKINDGFIKYGYIAPTSSLIASENDSKLLADFEEALKDGITNNGDFAKANDLAKDVFKENSTVYRGTKIIIAGQYSAINVYGQNASVKITGMDQEAFDAIFRNCGGNVDKVGYEAYTTYMTEVRAYLNVHTEQQINDWNTKVAEDQNLDAKATEKYNLINEYITNNRVELVTPENLNKLKLDSIEKENQESNKSLNDRLNNGDKLVTDKNGNQSIITGGHVTDEEKAAIENADKEQAEKDAEIKYENGYSKDENGNIVDSDGNKMGDPVDGAPTMTEDEIKDREDEANDLLKDNNGIISEEFTPIDPVVVEETVVETEDGKVVSTNTKSTIDDLKDLRDQLNSVADNEVTTTQSSTPIEDVVSYDLDEGWIFNPETGQVEVAPGYSFDSEGNLVKVNIK